MTNNYFPYNLLIIKKIFKINMVKIAFLIF